MRVEIWDVNAFLRKEGLQVRCQYGLIVYFIDVKAQHLLIARVRWPAIVHAGSN